MDYEALSVLASWAGVVLALASLIWNIYNTSEIKKHDNVHLQLKPVTTILLDCDVPLLAWDITNLSHFSVEIEEIGLTSKKTFFRKKSLVKIPIFSPLLTRAPARLDSQLGQPISFPIRLERRDSITLAAPHHNELRIAKTQGCNCIYTTTSCRHSVTANIGSLDDFFKEVQP